LIAGCHQYAQDLSGLDIFSQIREFELNDTHSDDAIN
jgi:hypothetical protein